MVPLFCIVFMFFICIFLPTHENEMTMKNWWIYGITVHRRDHAAISSGIGQEHLG